MNSYEILTGLGTLYVAAVSAVAPDVDEVPAGGTWTNLGAIADGVKINADEKIAQIRVDGRTGIVKAVRSEEGFELETKLAQATLENLAKLAGKSVTTTAAGAGTPGTKKITLYKGRVVQEYALLFRGDESPYGAYPQQWYIPRGYFDTAGALEFKKDSNVLIPCKFVVMEDLNAATEADRFGNETAQNALAI